MVVSACILLLYLFLMHNNACQDLGSMHCLFAHQAGRCLENHTPHSQYPSENPSGLSEVTGFLILCGCTGKSTGEADQDWLAVNGLSPLLEAEAMSKAVHSGGQLLYADGLEFGLGDGSANFGHRALPKGTVRK